MIKNINFCCNSDKTCYNKFYGVLAQLGVRHTGSVEATGSSPVYSIVKSLVNTGLFSFRVAFPVALEYNTLHREILGSIAQLG